MKKHVYIIGSGFSSLSAACYMAQAGYEVEVLEKNASVGGRAQQFKQEGFTFDMGPTWYWMPDVFERFFSDFNKRPEDYYKLTRLDPGYRVFFGKDDYLNISATPEKIIDAFEKEEKGAGQKLISFLNKAEQNYNAAMKRVVYKPGEHPFELITRETIFQSAQFFQTISGYVHKHFNSPKLRQILEFPVLFLGAKPSDTPMFYSFMNHADFTLGTWYPEGGMAAVVQGMVKLAEELGVKIHTNANVAAIDVDDSGEIHRILVNDDWLDCGLLISGADYVHTESLLNEKFRSYSEKYWDNRVLAPSALLFYVGFDKKIEGVEHHSLFFDAPFEQHAQEIYDDPKWPEYPLFYASFASMSDELAAPEGCEAATFLIPLAPDLEDNDELREKYFTMIMKRMEHICNQSLTDHVVLKRSYCVNDFVEDYNSFKGNAYGLANTLRQTAFLRPKIRSKKVKNLFNTGQLTVPGPGVPPALISGKIVSQSILKKNQYETAI